MPRTTKRPSASALHRTCDQAIDKELSEITHAVQELQRGTEPTDTDALWRVVLDSLERIGRFRALRRRADALA